MILEKETFETFEYYSSALSPQSHKPIMAACDNCGKIRKSNKNRYRALCGSCARKGNRNSSGHKNALGCKRSDTTKAKISASEKGKVVSEESKALMRKNHADVKGENNPNYNGGKKAAEARHRAKRRKLRCIFLMHLKEGEVFHHVTNEHVIGIPEDVHQSFGGLSRKKHRTLVLQWLETHDKKKYKIVLCTLAKTSYPNR